MLKLAFGATAAVMLTAPAAGSTTIYQGNFATSSLFNLGGANIFEDLRISANFSNPVTLDYETLGRLNGTLFAGGWDDQPIYSQLDSVGTSFTFRFVGRVFVIPNQGSYQETLESFRIRGVTPIDTDYHITVSRFAVVPEPTSWAMMIGGFCMLGAAARRRARITIAYA